MTLSMFLKPTAHISTPHTSPRLSFHTLCSPLPAGSRPGSSASLHSSKESKSSKSQRREERRFQKAVEKEERRRLKRQVKDKEKAERNQRPNDADNRRSDDAENCHREAGMSLMYMYVYITAMSVMCFLSQRSHLFMRRMFSRCRSNFVCLKKRRKTKKTSCFKQVC